MTQATNQPTSRRAALKAGSSAHPRIVALYEKRSALNSAIQPLAPRESESSAIRAAADRLQDELRATDRAIEEEYYRNPSALAVAAWILVGELWDHVLAEPIGKRIRSRCQMLLPSLPAGRIHDHIAEIVENPKKPAGQMAFND